MCEIGLSPTRCRKVHIERKDQTVKDGADCGTNPDHYFHFWGRLEDLRVKDEKRQLDKP